MRPSSSLIYEPGAERGVPWGRDLFTFVTSAAGHMMRTLQRPQKNRPSKRQVNHRRFLHNMIHRKFAEIEAANRQLSSAIFSREVECTQVLSPLFVSTDQSNDTPKEAPTPLVLSMVSPDNSTPPNPQAELSRLRTLNFQLESPQEHLDLPHSHTFSADMYHTAAKACHHTVHLCQLPNPGYEPPQPQLHMPSSPFGTSVTSLLGFGD
ncbi:hypothetical protein JZ751_008285 [Albula glossodonta]|uniref:Uncharacterized protein n=1 Tax=Albula glossodonta TaxID=121402 RepID=A0A8T2N2G0_9TELE|nr:hypothetical protein JZ751_008285 [Albula glossodonta]